MPDPLLSLLFFRCGSGIFKNQQSDCEFFRACLCKSLQEGKMSFLPVMHGDMGDREILDRKTR